MEAFVPNVAFRDKTLSMFVRHDELLRQQENIERLIVGLESEVTLILAEKELIQQSWEALRELLDKFSAESLGMLKDLLNKGLKAIFNDRDYSIGIQLTDTKQKKLKLILIENTENGIVEVELSSNSLLMNGGGVLVVVSFLFQVFLIIMYGKRKFLVIDEGFTNISSLYVENFFRFLKYLHTEMGFDFLMVNHDQRFMPYFDKTYEVNMGKLMLK